jgi:N-ethylmaleimide reductase
MPGIVKEYVAAAKRAKQAGFDFIEIHSANGYLLDSFLQSCTNKRTDEYGGSFENRFRLIREVIEGILTVIPHYRLGIRFSPNGSFQGMVSTALYNLMILS